MPFNLTLPDGTVLNDVPDGTTKKDIIGKLQGNGLQIPKEWMAQEEPKEQLQTAFDNKKIGNDGGAFSAAVGGFNGAVPFGRKITSALGAGIAKVGGVDQPYSDLYNQAEADAQATAEANPKANLAGTVAGIANTVPLAIEKSLIGAVPTTGIRGTINAIPEALGSLGGWSSANTFSGAGKLAKAGNTVVQLGKGAALGAVGGALYGAGESQTGEELQGAASGAGLGAGLGAALPVASSALKSLAGGTKNVVKGAFARGIEELDTAGQAIKDLSSKAYGRMRETNAVFSPESSNSIVSSIDTALKADGPLNDGLHGNTVSVLNDLKDAADRPGFSLEELDQYRRLLSRIPRSAPEDTRKASIAIDAIDDAVNGVKDTDLVNGSREAIDALGEGRKAYSTYSKFDRIANIVENSGGDANKLKSGLQRFANDPKKTRGFTKDEIASLNEAAKNSTGEGLLKLAGKFGIDLGSSLSVGNAGLPAIFAATTSAASGAGTAGLGVVGGTVARQAQKYVARAKADDLLKLIESGGKVSVQDIKSLPTAEGMKFLNAIKNNKILLPSSAISLQEKS